MTRRLRLMSRPLRLLRTFRLAERIADVFQPNPDEPWTAKEFIASAESIGIKKGQARQVLSSLKISGSAVRTIRGKRRIWKFVL